jgi:hypothetical protein
MMTMASISTGVFHDRLQPLRFGSFGPNPKDGDFASLHYPIQQVVNLRPTTPLVLSQDLPIEVGATPRFR